MNTNEYNVLNPIISEGDTGDDVIILQSKLKDLAYFFASITGSFDEYTERAVMDFQKQNGLIASGVVNEETWQKLYQLTDELSPATYDTRPVLRLGSTGPYVTELQSTLKTLLYYTGEIDGNFGTSTENAVKRFQTNNNLTPDGIVGRNTWSALSSLYSPLAICEGNEGDQYIIYTVVAGDSLWSIANRFGTTIDAIKSLNNLTSDVLQIGQQLKIPTSEQNATIYTVVAGDSLWTIAKRFGTTVDAIKSLNNLTSDILQIGQRLKIPTSEQTTTYTVVAGDSLWSIANRFGTTVDAIKSLNNLTSDILQIGQQLKIPTSEQNATIYTVVAGDSLWTIAKRFGTTVDAIKSLNNLTSNFLNVGQQLRIPTSN